jgi:flagellar motility protein MotE (MotC chaperone)
MKFFSLPKIIVLGLGVAGMLKLSVDLMPMAAIAEAATDSALPAPEVGADLPATTRPTGDIIGSNVCEPSQVIADAIAEERALLITQRQEIADEQARLALAEESLRAEQTRLSETRDEIAAQLAVIEGAKDQDMTKLVELYRNMKPQVAAGIMDEIDIETAVEVIGAMAERDAAQIMGSFSLVRARLITKILLERSKLPADRNLEGLRLR